MWLFWTVFGSCFLFLMIIMGFQVHPQNMTNPWLSVLAVQIQQVQNQSQVYKTCIFGDSITSPLGNSFGKGVVNLAVGGLSTETLLTQLQRLNQSNIQCDHAIVAIGTNDACYGISDSDFILNYRHIIALLRAMGATRIQLIPAFYSTIAASHNPNFAGPIDRVDEINSLIDEVAKLEKIELIDSGLESLYKNHSLRSDLSSDGVHLNFKGQAIYRDFLINLLEHI